MDSVRHSNPVGRYLVARGNERKGGTPTRKVVPCRPSVYRVQAGYGGVYSFCWTLLSARSKQSTRSPLQAGGTKAVLHTTEKTKMWFTHVPAANIT